MASSSSSSRRISRSSRRFIIFCDDLAFDAGEADYKALRAVLDGGLAGRPANVIIYATSSRRHLLAREMIENERSTAIHAGEATEEKVSLSDRFGLSLASTIWIRTPIWQSSAAMPTRCSTLTQRSTSTRALAWAGERGSRSGRTAWQFVQNLGLIPPGN
ncbi:DUF815 domain-containing protein [Novosphingobium sp. UBA1939]|uniref:DUF815 domain-containing protein n=1 Tax=Novosphingobium sp. UBA1939 TaxID=1946982 RepID=UPI0025E45B2E|nr:DUF815 domain-containing protein [Novosphingobium sp. UBA1939]